MKALTPLAKSVLFVELKVAVQPHLPHLQTQSSCCARCACCAATRDVVATFVTKSGKSKCHDPCAKLAVQTRQHALHRRPSSNLLESFSSASRLSLSFAVCGFQCLKPLVPCHHHESCKILLIVTLGSSKRKRIDIFRCQIIGYYRIFTVLLSCVAETNCSNFVVCCIKQEFLMLCIGHNQRYARYDMCNCQLKSDNCAIPPFL